MNRKELIKRQTWIYFWQQKVVEIFVVLIIIAFLALVPFYLGKWDPFNNIPNGFEDVSPFDKIYQNGFATIGLLLCWSIALGFCGAILYLFYLALEEWMKSNWEKAKRRAKKKFQNKRRKK